MKRYICIVYFLFLLFFVVAEDFNFSPLYYLSMLPLQQGRTFLYKDKTVLLEGYYSSDSAIEFCPAAGVGNFIDNYIERIDSGYVYIKCDYIDSNNSTENFYVIEGKGIVIIENTPKTVKKRGLTDNEQKYEKWFLLDKYDVNSNGTEGEGWGRVYIIDDGIQSITATSELSEGSTRYAAANLKDRLYTETSDDNVGIFYDSITPPWVEGSVGYGIGESLNVKFKYKSDEIQILNGFVDTRRMYLYKENSRVKTVLIESESPEFSQEYELEDVVRYNVLQLPAKTDKIRITIKAVYPGDKYEDTCLSSIVVTNPELPGFEEQKEKVMRIMQKTGVWKTIEEFKAHH